ncbi:MAG: hypothetical protein IJX47_03830 [Clostridia bacterium]|nr:hypothetical protein [Clostridia bacterium]
MTTKVTSKENGHINYQDSEQALLLFLSLSEEDQEDILRIMREKQNDSEIKKQE